MEGHRPKGLNEEKEVAVATLSNGQMQIEAHTTDRQSTTDKHHVSELLTVRLHTIVQVDIPQSVAHGHAR